ncbi:MAG: Glycosyl transferase group 1 [Candidatus Amesbacteria bacterium GW2011_GWB1_48_13]|uniref:Glycosyl transferase group 1 n=1 Tax=Candidatus Amesbacteria bacterium GW2011_GWB1_48_13 TaxID=1618362 RepID=A0A0G1XML8_9BACT|nr:MAG: Glycosyl transferase group 1 [Candidatus Amesbacteria bacterium GW2011_GWB1_48_13]
MYYTPATGMKAVFLDVDNFANERFSSGLFKYIRAILLRFKLRDDDIKIISIAHYLRVQNPKDQKTGIFHKIIKGVPIVEYLQEKTSEKSIVLYRNSIQKALTTYNPDIIFLNSTAVFLDEINIVLLEEAVNSGAKVVMFVVDHLFPTYANHPKSMVDRYYNLMKKTEIISCSPFIIEHLFKESGLKASLFLNLISIPETISKTGSHNFISMVNIHPVKGLSIFNKIVRKLPNKKFLLIKNWPDVPIYHPPANVLLKNYYSDVRKFYQRTQILLVPSLHDEGQPTVITEAMLNGIPVIANAIGGIPEIPSAPGFFLVPPPSINGFRQVGTILYPNLKEAEVEAAANRYVEIINTIESEPEGWRKYAQGLISQARATCKKSEASFEQYYQRWSQPKQY